MDADTLRHLGDRSARIEMQANGLVLVILGEASACRYAISSAGNQRQSRPGVYKIGYGPHTAPRRATQPGAAFTAHTLAVSELYVQLVERSRAGAFRIAAFDAEPACWWPDDTGSQLKPDAHTLLAANGYQDAWWIEVDQATETLPRLKKKLQTYLDYAARGGIGPAGVLPRVLLTTPTAQRCTAITDLIAGLPPPAEDLFHATPHQAAADLLIGTLTQP